MINGVVFAVDDNGHSHHKLAALIDGQIKTWKVPSVVGDGSATITNTQGDVQDTYSIDGSQFCCNEQIQQKIDIRNATYQVSPENKALIAHTLAHAGLDTKPIALGVTLPWRDAFSKDGKVNQDVLGKVAGFYSNGKIVNLGTGKEIQIVKAKPYVEGLSAFYDWGIDNAGSTEKASSTKGPVCVIDIGGSTTDIVTLLGGTRLSVDHSRSNTKKIGVLDAKNQVEKKLSEKIRSMGGIDVDADGGIAGWMVEQAFLLGRVKVGSMPEIDMQESLLQIQNNVANQILSFIKSTIGNVLGYQTVIFVGGGAIVFQDVLKKLVPHAEFLDEFANARGALKYMLQVDKPFLESVSNA